MSRILLLEDDLSLVNGLSFAFKKWGFSLDVARTLLEAERLWEDRTYDLLVLDVALPDGSGFAFCQKVRRVSKVPIIFLTASDEEMNIIMGLDIGGDDYITKPFRPLEMVARVKAQLRRYKKYNQNQSQKGDEEGVLVHAGLVMNVKTHTCLLHEKELVLTPTEFEILRVLMEKRGEVVSTETLFHKLWKDEYYSKAGNSITVHIRHLREKMNDTAEDPKYIRTVWGVGYKMET